MYGYGITVSSTAVTGSRLARGARSAPGSAFSHLAANWRYACMVATISSCRGRSGRGIAWARPPSVRIVLWLPERLSCPGVTLGKGCLVAAGAMVTKPAPDFAFLRGSPARVVGDTRDLDRKHLEDPAIQVRYFDPETAAALATDSASSGRK